MKYKIGDIVERVKYSRHDDRVGIVTDVSGKFIKVEVINDYWHRPSWCLASNFKLFPRNDRNNISKEDLEFMYYTGQSHEAEGVSNFEAVLKELNND